MNDKTRQKALDILEGMRTIARADMMDTDAYISPRVENPHRINSVCRGHKACAIGSLWLAGDVRPCRDGSEWNLPGVLYSERAKFLRNRHALRAAYNALNEAADDYIDRKDIFEDTSGRRSKPCLNRAIPSWTAMSAVRRC